LGLAVVLPLQIPTTASQSSASSTQGPTASASESRAFSASQLIGNLTSIGQGQSGSLGGTVAARDVLWSLIFHQQVADGKLLYGYGFGVNLPYLVNDTQITLASGTDALRSPHNSHDDVLARMGLVGFFLWIALWLGWYRRMVTGCRRLARRGMHVRRQVGVLCMMVATAILVSALFDPQLEGAQAAALLWTAFGVGVAVTSRRGWFGLQTPTSVTAKSPSQLRARP
jgi:hypothetical protein